MEQQRRCFVPYGRRNNVSPEQTVKNMIAGDAVDGTLKSVVIVGHVTVPYSGPTDYDSHGNRAMPTDQYYADLDATPQTWGDINVNVSYLPTSQGGDFRGDPGWEFTWNKPGDGRFDANCVPGDAQVVTITGEDDFTLSFKGAETDTLPANATADEVRDALHDLPTINPFLSFVTVTQVGTAHHVRFFGALTGDQPLMEASGSASVSALDTGGAELSFGRIDMANLGLAFSSPEEDLLRSYFQRAHNYRTARFRPENKALVQDDGQIGNPNFAAVLGDPNVEPGYWLQKFTAADPTNYLFASRTGLGALSQCNNGSQPFSSFNFGDAGLISPPPGTEDDRPVHAVFTMVGGSYMGDWNNRSFNGSFPNNVPLPRSLIAANFQPALMAEGNGEALVSMSLDQSKGFRAAAAGLIRPEVVTGEPAGEGFREAINEYLGNTPHGLYQQFLGDPTLRLSYVKPVTDLKAQTQVNGTRVVQWQDSADSQSAGFLGYHVYRASSSDGPFTRITSTYVSGTSYPDSFTTTGRHFYMVRAVKSESTAYGAYANASTGVIVGTTAAAATVHPFEFADTHEITIQFDRNVQAPLSESDLVLTNITTDTEIPAENIDFHAYNTSTNTATFRFTGIENTAQDFILPKGNYRLVISAEDVSINGEPMVADAVLDFFVLPGDANHDRHVNLDDFNTMTANFGTSGKNFTQGNFNYDALGNVDLADFNLLAANFGTDVPEPVAGPGVVTVTVMSSSSITVNWIDDVDGEQGWRVQRSEDGQNFTWYENIDPDRTAYLATGLQQGKRYWWRVRAWSDPPGPNTAYTPKKAGTTIIPAPSNFLAQYLGLGVAQLTWSHSSQNVSDIVVQRSTNGQTWTTLSDNLSPTDTSFQDTGLASGRHYYRVYLTNGLIDSAPSFERYVDVP